MSRIFSGDGGTMVLGKDDWVGVEDLAKRSLVVPLRVCIFLCLTIACYKLDKQCLSVLLGEHH
jgi:hypothetical protein